MAEEFSRIAVIDIGTNSVLYLLAEKGKDGLIRGLHQEFRSPRLGKGLGNTHRISQDAIGNTIPILKEYVALSKKQNAHRVIAVATHGLRIAENRSEVVRRFREETGLKVEILTEEQEAKASFLGAIYQRQISGPVCVVDIGGGSTEMIFGENGHIEFVKSIPIGAVTLTEQGEGKIENHLEEMLKAHFNFVPVSFKCGMLVGVGGTITTLAGLELGLSTYDPNRVDGFWVPFSKIEYWYEKLASLSPEKRRALFKFDPDRADILPAGLLILKTLCTLGNFEKILVSDRGLRFGIALQQFEVN